MESLWTVFAILLVIGTALGGSLLLRRTSGTGCGLSKTPILSGNDGSFCRKEQKETNIVQCEDLPEHKESRGRSSRHVRLPKECNSWAALEAAGVKQLDEADDLLVNVQLPPGWQVKQTNHYIWSDLFDEKGRRRASIVHKGVLWDPYANMMVLNRFSIRGDTQLRVLDSEVVELYHTDTITRPSRDSSCEEWKLFSRQSTRLWEDARRWLDSQYPDWRNPSAYWDDPVSEVA